MGFDNAGSDMEWSLMTLKTAIYTNEALLAHYAGDGHPESPKRLSSILEAMRKSLSRKQLRKCRVGERAQGYRQ
jgi:acetoin utilization deacetylase AcuC-like enzyme